MTLKIGSCFSGIGGFELGLERVLEAETIWQIEIDPYCRKVLEKHWPDADRTVTDIRQANATNVKRPDILCAGFPCQGISKAGYRKGLADERSGLFYELVRLVGELLPPIVVLENTPNVIAYGDEVFGELVQLGYNIEWKILSAQQLGAPHIRKRWFGIAYFSDSLRSSILQKPRGGEGESRRRLAWKTSVDSSRYGKKSEVARHIGGTWRSKPEVRRICHGIPDRVDRNRALGNAIVPDCAAVVGLRLLEVINASDV